MQDNLALALFVVGLTSLLLTTVTHACVTLVLARRRAPHALPPISVLKPLKGDDAALFDNLASLACQDYPTFELVFGCEDVTDPALFTARRVARAYPNVAVTIVAGGRAIGLNPKVNNLAQLTAAARHELLLVSDADVRVDPGYFRALAAEMNDPEVGLVSSVIAGTLEGSLGATFDTLHLNGMIAGTVCGAHVLASHPCVIGKSMLFRRTDLERVGGWAAVKDVLAEDYVLGQLFHAAGRKVALSGFVIHAVCGARSLRSFASRHLRWSQMRRHIAPLHYFGEPLLHTSPWFLCAALLDPHDGLPRLFPLAGLLATCVLHARAGRRLRGEPVPLSDLVLVPVKDLVVLLVWALGWFKNTVEWRGNVLRIGPGSRLSPESAAGPTPTGQKAH